MPVTHPSLSDALRRLTRPAARLLPRAAAVVARLPQAASHPFPRIVL